MGIDERFEVVGTGITAVFELDLGEVLASQPYSTKRQESAHSIDWSIKFLRHLVADVDDELERRSFRSLHCQLHISDVETHRCKFRELTNDAIHYTAWNRR